MADTFTFELVTPEKLLFSKPVAMVTVPGGEGDYGVLAHHAPMITTVKAGVIHIYADDENTVSERIFVAGGFAEVTEQRCAVLAEEAVEVHKLDPNDIEHRIQALRLSLEHHSIEEDERAKVEEEIAVEEAKLHAANMAA